MSDEYWDRWFERRRPFFGGDIFDDMDDVFREMGEMMQKQFEGFSKRSSRDLVRERTLPDGSKVQEFGPFIYGYSITIGQDGKPQIREFGNVNPKTKLERRKIDIKEQREPLIDIIQTSDEVKVIAELPGIEKEEIKLHATNKSLTISVDTPERKYHKELKLQAEVDTKKMKSSYKNGVLEITLQKKKEALGEPVKL